MDRSICTMNDEGICYGCDKIFKLKEIEEHYKSCYTEDLDDHLNGNTNVWGWNIKDTLKNTHILRQHMWVTNIILYHTPWMYYVQYI